MNVLDRLPAWVEPWMARLALVLLAVALLAWPEALGDPTRVRQ